MKYPELPFGIFKFLGDANLAQPGDHVLIACSGGIDSTALLHLLTEHIPKRWENLKVSVAYLNHRIHEKAEEMAAFVELACNKADVDFYSDSVDVPALKKKSRQSIEHIGRFVRYEFLCRTAKEIGANLIATGHNQNDQDETILMMILEGSGITGLRGMPFSRIFRGEENLYLIRPLLEFSREEIERFMKLYEYKYKEDPTNLDTNYLRNRLRHKVLPFLEKEGNKQVRKHLRGLASEIRILFEEKDPEIELALKKNWHFEGDNPHLNLDGLQSEAPAMKGAVMLNVLKDLGISPRDLKRQNIDSLVELTGKHASKEVELPGGWIAFRTLDAKIEFKHDSIKEIKTRRIVGIRTSEPFEINNPGDTAFVSWGKTFKLEVTERFVTEEDIARAKTRGNKLEIYMQPTFGFTSPYMFRRRHRGDKIRPFGLKGDKKLKKFFLDKRVDIKYRDDWPLIVDSFGKIIWVIGLEISDYARVKNFEYKALIFKVIEYETDSFPKF